MTDAAAPLDRTNAAAEAALAALDAALDAWAGALERQVAAHHAAPAPARRRCAPRQGSRGAAGDQLAPNVERDGLRAYLREIAGTPLLTRERADDAARRLRALARAAEVGAPAPDSTERRALAAL